MTSLFPSCARVLVGVLQALALTGCCSSSGLETRRETHVDTLEGEDLAEVLERKQTDLGRCEYACVMTNWYIHDTEQVLACEAVGADESLPTWDPGQLAVTVTCEIEYLEESYCPPI